MQRLPDTVHHTRWVDYNQICQGGFTAILVLNPMDAETAYLNSASRHYCLQWHVWSHGWHDASFGQEKDTVEGRFILHGVVRAANVGQILCWSYSNHRYASPIGTHSWLFPEAAIIGEVGQVNRYQSCRRDIFYYPTPWGLPDVCGGQILRQTQMFAGH